MKLILKEILKSCNFGKIPNFDKNKLLIFEKINQK
jgi:hypothetical protein